MVGFAGIDLSTHGVTNATTLLKFHRLLEAHGLAKSIFGQINTMLAGQKLLMSQGMLIDATIIAAPSSTKNQSGRRDADMHQTKKGNQWHVGMKAHIGADAQSRLVHTVVGTAADASDIVQAHALLHGEESTANGDAGCLGVEKRTQIMEKHP